MNILSQESFSRIEPLIADDYKKTYSRLKLMLGADDVDIFARVDVLPNQGKWWTDVMAQVKPFSAASALEKEQIAAYLEDGKRRISAQLAEKLPYVDTLFRIPDENQIFWYVDQAGRIRVVLSQWGFRRINQPGDVDVIEFLIAQPRTMTVVDSTIRIMWSDGNPVADTNFGLTIFNNSTNFTTDANGEHFLGKVPAGQHFEVTAQDGKRWPFDSQEGRETYDITIDRLTSWSITVLDQDGNTIAGFPLKINGDGMATDENGKIAAHNVRLTGGDTLTVTDSEGAEQRYALSPAAEDNNFTFRIEIEKEKPEEPVIPTPPAPAPAAPKKPVRVRILDIDGSPLDNVEVFIDQPGGTTLSAMTDADGYAEFAPDTFVDKKKSKIRFRLTKEYQQRREEMKRQNKARGNGK